MTGQHDDRPPDPDGLDVDWSPAYSTWTPCEDRDPGHMWAEERGEQDD